MTIKQFEHATDLPRTTIRFYESRGLLEPEASPNGYRRYKQRHVERARAIRVAQRLGFSLTEIKELMTLWEGGALGRREKRAALQSKLDVIEQRLSELEQMRTYLEAILTWVNGGERGPKPLFGDAPAESC